MIREAKAPPTSIDLENNHEKDPSTAQQRGPDKEHSSRPEA